MADDVVRKDQYAAEHVEAMKTPQESHHVEGNALLINKQGEIRKVPVPSNDPNDPLNFRTWEKYAVIICCCWFSLNALSLPSGLGSFITVLFELYAPQGYGPNQIALLLTLASLCIGLGNFIILPIALAVGRRPVFLISTVILLASTIGAGAQNSYNAHIACRVIQGLSAGASESLLPLMITEVTFLHERGRVLGAYWMIQNILSSVFNLTSSYEVAALGWRWYYWIFAITIGVGLILVIFTGFETSFKRSAISIDGQIVATNEYGVTYVVPDDEAQEYLDRANNTGSATDSNIGGTKSCFCKVLSFGKVHDRPLQIIVGSWYHMALALTSPAILYVILITSLSLGSVVFMSLTYDGILQGYGWQPKDVGLINVGAIVGAFLAMGYCTFIGEPIQLMLAKRNHGVHKPEHRLILLMPVCCLGFAMLLVYGFTATGVSAWGPIIAYTFFIAAFISSLIISSTFAAEASPKHPGPALVMVVGTKNIVSFGLSYALTPTIGTMSFSHSFGILAGVWGGISLLGFPVYWFNPRWRRYMSSSKEQP